MAESLARAWILKYFINTAEEYGAKIGDVPLMTKKHKVQLVELLTFPKTAGDVVWAKVSDKHFEVPVKITTQALAKYNQDNGVLSSNHRRITARKHSVAFIRDFRPFFSRIPLGNGKGIDKVARLALEVGYIEITGADHEGIFGSPKTLEQNEDVMLWTNGLREDGGGGNILKLMKEQREREDAEKHDNGGDNLPPLPALPRVTVKPEKNKNGNHKSGNHAKVKVNATNGKATFEVPRMVPTVKNPVYDAWKDSWKLIDRNPRKYGFMPQQATEALLEILQFGRDLNKATLISNDTTTSRSPSPHASPRTAPSHPSRDPLDLGGPYQVDQLDMTRPTTPSNWELSDAEDGHSKIHNAEGLAANKTKSVRSNVSQLDDKESQKGIAISVIQKISCEVSNDGTSQESQLLKPRVSSEMSQAFPLSPPTPAQRQRTKAPLTFPPSMLNSQHSNAIDENSLTLPSASYSAKSDHINLIDARPSGYSLKLDVSPSRLSTTDISQDSDRPVRILVPDSDRSGSASQGRSQSQSQSQPQSCWSQSQPQSQPQMLLQSQSRIETSKLPDSQTQSETQSSSNPSMLPPNRLKIAGHLVPGSPDIERHSQSKSTVAEENITTRESARSTSQERSPSKRAQETVEAQTLEHDDMQTQAMFHQALSKVSSPEQTQSRVLGDDALTPHSQDSPRSRMKMPGTTQRSAVSRGPSPSLARCTIPKAERNDVPPSPFIPQSSPSTHLSKHSSSKLLHAETSSAGQQTKMGIDPSSEMKRIFSSDHDYVVQPVVHDSAAWKTASFIRNAQKARGDSLVLSGDEPHVSPSVLTLKRATSDDSRPRKRTKLSTAANALSSTTSGVHTTANVDVHHVKQVPKSRKVRSGVGIDSESALTNQEPMNPRPKLDGFTINFDQRRDGNGPPLLTWRDTAKILLKIGRIRHEETNVT